MQQVQKGNTGCMRVKINSEGEKQMMTGVNKRHKSEGGTSRVTGKKNKRVPGGN